MAHALAAPRGRGRPRAGEEIDLDVLLQAALEAFAETGYDGTSVRELSRRLGMSHAPLAGTTPLYVCPSPWTRPPDCIWRQRYALGAPGRVQAVLKPS
jgi:hypothetical protein